MDSKAQAEHLNKIAKLRLAPSKIHGVGVFATRDIKKGEKLYSDLFPTPFSLPFKDFDLLLPEVRDMILERFPTVPAGSRFVYPDTILQAYMNHSDKPNYDAINDITLEEIKKGEEVTEDYRAIDNYQLVYPWVGVV